MSPFLRAVASTSISSLVTSSRHRSTFLLYQSGLRHQSSTSAEITNVEESDKDDLNPMSENANGVLQISRFDPSCNTQKLDSYSFKKTNDFMVLDLLVAVKAHQDPSLAFRASCCEGVCGSCAMNINGVNSLACVTYAQKHTVVGPLPNMPVIKDLVVDFKLFFGQYSFIRPYIRNLNLDRYHIQSIYKRYNEMMSTSRTRPAITNDNDGSILFHNVPDKRGTYLRLIDRLIAQQEVKKVLIILLKMRQEGLNLSKGEEAELLRAAATPVELAETSENMINKE